MRNDEYRAGVFLERILKKTASVKVKMGRRLVEKEEIGGGEEKAQERKTYLFAAGKDAGRLLDVVFVEAERAKLVAELLLRSAAVRIPCVLCVSVHGDVRRYRLRKLLRKVSGDNIVPKHGLAARGLAGAGDDAH